MKKTRRTISVLVLIWLAGTCAEAQDQRPFIDHTNGFQVTLFGNWKAVSYSDVAGRSKTEFISESRDRGLLRIARDTLNGSNFQDLVRREIENFTLCNSCVTVGQEVFTGVSLSGTRVFFYYVESDRRMVATFYFLREKGGVVWLLRFTGRDGSPGMAREITDSIARTFAPYYEF